MSKNLELKIKLKSFDDVIEKLNSIDANFEKELRQKDIYYSVDNGLLKLRIQNGEGELIRYNRNETGEDRFSDYEILNVDPIKAENFFNEIFKTETIVEKNRRLYLFNNTRIHLDDVKELGKFLELETLVINDEPDAKQRFDFLVDKLNINFNDQIRKSYRDLILTKHKK